MKIIVTGGAGFIGSHVADAYIRAGHRVAVIDNLSTGFRKNLNPKAKFYRADIRNPEAIEKIFAREKPDVVNHHAALISVTESMRNPGATIETNVRGTLNLAVAFGAQKKKAKFIFASTGGAMYGDPKRVPVKETGETNPLSIYGISKLAAEKIIILWARKYSFSYLIFRYANVYGPRQNAQGGSGIVPIFAKLMREGRRPTIFGGGSTGTGELYRDYVYVEDIARANALGLKRGKNEILNFGLGTLVSNQEVFDTMARALDFRRKPIYAPHREGEVRRISLDSRRAKKILGWKPKIMLQEGIKMTLKQF